MSFPTLEAAVAEVLERSDTELAPEPVSLSDAARLALARA
jgi:hypothetical protein